MAGDRIIAYIQRGGMFIVHTYTSRGSQRHPRHKVISNGVSIQEELYNLIETEVKN